jgi:5-hydroxyisourate hydrolase-like protein (transthyretin family)
MKAISSRFLSTLLTTFFLAAAAHAGTLSGTVINRTTGKPEPNVDLDLLSPTQGMVELATAKSDAQGRFSVTKDNIGMAPILVRATFHDVSFNTFAPPGRPEVEVEIFDISKDPKTISVPSHVVIFQPENGKLIGAEEYTVQNTSQPPHAYFRTEGNFDFAIPENGTLGQVTTTATMGMAVTQASIDKGKGRFSIAFAFRPGQTNVRLSYELPYTNNSAALKLPATYPGAKLLVVAPPGVILTGDGLTSAGQEQGMMVYTHDPLPAKGVLSVSLSGEGSPQAASGGQDQGATQEGNSRQGPEVMAAPSRLDDFKWYLFAGIAALFAMGAILLTRKQVFIAAGDVDEDAAPPSTKSAKPAPPAKPKKAPPAPAPAPPPVPPANVAAEVNQQVGLSMDSLKDQIFRLELRRQAGTISEEDYAREKARFDKLLRDLVKG